MSFTADGQRMLPALGNVGSNTSWTMNNLPNGTYYWKVQAVDQTFKGSLFSDERSFVIGSAMAEASPDDENAFGKSVAVPSRFALHPNYPNPFNPSTRINLELPESGHVRAIVYDLQGKEVFRLREGEMNSGYHVLDWDGRSTAGTAVGSGTYIVKVSFEGVNGLREEGRQQVLLVK